MGNYGEETKRVTTSNINALNKIKSERSLTQSTKNGSEKYISMLKLITFSESKYSALY